MRCAPWIFIGPQMSHGDLIVGLMKAYLCNYEKETRKQNRNSTLVSKRKLQAWSSTPRRSIRNDVKKWSPLLGILEQIPLEEHYKSYIKFIQQERMTILNLSIPISKFGKLLATDFQRRVRNVLLHFQKRNQFHRVSVRGLLEILFEV